MTLTFWTKTADMFISVGVPDARQIGLSFQVHLITEQEIEIASGENFYDLDGRIAVLPEIENSENQRNDIGKLSYFEPIKTDFLSSPASYIVDVRVPKPQFDELLAAARASHIPSAITIYVDGLEFGFAPDGSEVKWDNRTSPTLKVTAASFTIPLFRSDTTNDSLP